MRNKIIRAFVAVWCVVCLSYVGVRSAVAALVDGSAIVREDAEATSSLAEQADPKEQAGQTTPNSTAQSAPEAQPNPTEQAEPTPQAAPEPEPETQARPESSTASPNPVAQEEQEAEAEDVPLLREYLSGFTCGSCRRNCSLDNPRCHNGSRLAKAKAEEYYSIYGQ